jgi:hypothetical protein
MDYKFHSMEELQKLKGKNVRIQASPRMMQRCRMHINGMYFRVVSVIENTKELFLEPLIPEFKDELQLLPLSLIGIEWGIDDISEPK